MHDDCPMSRRGVRAAKGVRNFDRFFDDKGMRSMALTGNKVGILFSAAIAIVAVPALAQSPSATDIIKALRPKTADKITGSRSLDGLFGERGVSMDEGQEVPSIDIRVNFALDSIKLENETLLTLRSLGNALSSEELSGQKILIIGHTDARGTDEYNDDLSKRRAAAVVDYMKSNFDIDTALVTSEGHGEHDLLYPDDPENDLNRRVEIRNVTGTE